MFGGEEFFGWVFLQECYLVVYGSWRDAEFYRSAVLRSTGDFCEQWCSWHEKFPGECVRKALVRGVVLAVTVMIHEGECSVVRDVSTGHQVTDLVGQCVTLAFWDISAVDDDDGEWAVLLFHDEASLVTW